MAVAARADRQAQANAQSLNYHLAGFSYPRPRASYSPEITRRTMAGLLGAGYDSAGAAYDVSADVVDGVLAVRVRGRTFTNVVSNGDFSNGTAGWTAAAATIAAAANVLSITGTGTAQFPQTRQTLGIACQTARKLYIRIKCRVTTTDATSLFMQVTGSVGGSNLTVYNQATPTQNQWYTLSGIATLTDQTGSVKLAFGHGYADAATANGKVMQVEGLPNGVMTIDVDTLPAHLQALSDADLKTYLDANYPFITGTRSTPPQRVRSVGKNVWGGMKAAMDIVRAVGNSTYAYITVVDGRTCLALKGDVILGSKSVFKGFAPNTRYTLSVEAKRGTADSDGGIFIIRYTDGSSTYLSATNIWTLRSVTSTIGKSIASCGPASSTATVNYYDIDTLQLEVGAAATAYEPYVESVAYTLPTLRAVPAAADDIDFMRGEHVRRIVDGAASIADSVYASLDNTTYANVDVVKTTAFSGAVAGTTAADGTTYLLDKNGVPLTEIAAANIDEVASIGKYYYHTDKTAWFITAADTYADIAAARVGLGTSTLLYQLATPVVTKLPRQVLNTYQGGSLIVEPVLAGSQKPNAATGKIDIDRATTWPSSSIESVYRHDVQPNGQVLFADVTASCTLTDDGTTITIADVDKTKVYSYSCLIDSRYNPGCEIVTRVPLCCARFDLLGGNATVTPTTDQANAPILIFANAGADFDVTLPSRTGEYTIINATTKMANCKRSGGTPAAVAAGKTARIAYNGSEYVLVATQA